MPRHLIGDAHEWINEIPTVPTYSLAKLQPSRRSWDLYLCVFVSRECLNAFQQYIIINLFIIIFFFRHSVMFRHHYCVYVQQRGKKTLLSLTLICYCHLVGM
eukprot:764825_1